MTGEAAALDMLPDAFHAAGRHHAHDHDHRGHRMQAGLMAAGAARRVTG
jgi:hypothetical protein